MEEQRIITIRVKYFAQMRDITGRKEDVINLTKGSTVKDALNELCKIFGDNMKRYLFKNGGQLREELQVLVNGLSIDSSNLCKKSLSNGDTLVIIPPVGGG
ncbi:MAG: ubiquitin-like small modifier protein 1 [Nitrososphaerota archaeon]|nr:MoaD family protein [Nitrososphaerales archaeon]MDW8044927.1 ubiquitin-like small modifier protein 1 [Nitrososphaerota archaeon]